MATFGTINTNTNINITITITSTLLALLRSTLASPTPTPAPGPRADAVIDVAPPIITVSPPPTRTFHFHQRRGIIDDVKSDVGGVLSELGSDLPSYVASGVPNFFQNFPTGDAALSSAGVKSTDLDAKPTEVLNIPSYANWTDSGWSLRFRGNVYKTPDISNSTINRLANVFLIDTSVEELPPSQSAQAVNLTREIFVAQQDSKNVTFDLQPAPSFGADGEPGGGGAITPPGGNFSQIITLPYVTTSQGDFDTFVQLQNTSGALYAGNETQSPQRINVYTQGTDTGNATSYLLPSQGLTIISDIDDILRVTKIYQPKEGLLNSFARPFTPWMNMPSIYANWSRSLPNASFHYLTTTPEQVTRNYMDFIYKTYPGGSFDTRPLNFSDVDATLSIREYLLDKIFQTFPKRKFVLVADTSNSDVMKDYPLMATRYPGQVSCILLRNTSSTDSGDRFPYNTEGFKGLNQQSYMFFHVPDDLTNLDIANGQCLNATIKQNITFGYQGLPFGITTGNGKSAAPGRPAVSGSWTLLLSGVLAVAIAEGFSLFSPFGVVGG